MALNWLGMSQVWVANLPIIQVFPSQDKHRIALISNMAMCVGTVTWQRTPGAEVTVYLGDKGFLFAGAFSHLLKHIQIMPQQKC